MVDDFEHLPVPKSKVADERDGLPDVLRPHVLVRVDVNTNAITAIMNVVGCEHRVGRRARGQPCEHDHRAAVNPLQINEFAPSAEHARG